MICIPSIFSKYKPIPAIIVPIISLITWNFVLDEFSFLFLTSLLSFENSSTFTSGSISNTFLITSSFDTLSVS